MPIVIIMKALVVIALLAVTLSSCSGSPAPRTDEPAPRASGKPLQVSDCLPLDFPSTGDPVGDMDESQLVTSAALDLFIGATEVEATACATSMGLTVRLASRDGKDYMLTMDYSPTRVNFTVEEEIVTAATVG